MSAPVYELVSAKGHVRAVGTVYQISKGTGLPPRTLYWYQTPAAKRRGHCPAPVRLGPERKEKG